MNAVKKPSFLPCLATVFGTAAFGLRKCLYAFALDQKGLLVSGHPLTYGLWAVVALGTACILWTVCRADLPGQPESRCSSRAAAGGSAFFAASLLVTVLNVAPTGTGTLVLLWRLLGFLSAPAVMWAGVCLGRGKQPFFGTHALVCLFLLVHMVSRYQAWSGNPQLQDYVFELLAAVALTLFSYHCAAAGADMGKPRMRRAAGGLAVLLCAVALSGTATFALYLGGLIWAFTALCAPEVTAHEDP